MVEHDGEVEVCSEIEIKEEPESDEDDDCQLKIEEGDLEVGDINNKAHGQTSLDLATDKKDVSLIVEVVFHCFVFCTGRLKDYQSQVYEIFKCNFITNLTIFVVIMKSCNIKINFNQTHSELESLHVPWDVCCRSWNCYGKWISPWIRRKWRTWSG